MNIVNVQFLEAYKHLDKICREIYCGEKGITAYIDDMKCIGPYESRNIQDWNTDLQKLVDLRHKRNRLTHDCGTIYEELAEESDTLWLNEFYDRILTQNDPLAQLKKFRESRKKSKNISQMSTTYAKSHNDIKYSEKRKDNSSLHVVLWTGLLLFGIWIVMQIIAK